MVAERMRSVLDRHFDEAAPEVQVVPHLSGMVDWGSYEFVRPLKGCFGIIDELASRFDAPRNLIAVDVAAMLKDLADKGVLRW